VRTSVLTDAAEGHSYATEQRDRIFGASTSASPPSTRWNAYAFEPDGVEGAALALAARRIRFQHEQLATFIQRADRDSGAVSKGAEPEAGRQSRDGTGGLGGLVLRRESRRAAKLKVRKVRAAGSVGDGGNAPNDDRGRDRIDRGAFLIAFPRSYGGRMRLITSQLKMQFQY